MDELVRRLLAAAPYDRPARRPSEVRSRELTYGDDKFIIQKNAAFPDNKGQRQQRGAQKMETHAAQFRVALSVGSSTSGTRLLNYHSRGRFIYD